MSGRLRDKALKFFNAAKYQQEHGLFEDSLKNYLFSLNIQKKMAKFQKKHSDRSNKLPTRLKAILN